MFGLIFLPSLGLSFFLLNAPHVPVVVITIFNAMLVFISTKMGIQHFLRFLRWSDAIYILYMCAVQHSLFTVLFATILTFGMGVRVHRIRTKIMSTSNSDFVFVFTASISGSFYHCCFYYCIYYTFTGLILKPRAALSKMRCAGHAQSLLWICPYLFSFWFYEFLIRSQHLKVLIG